MTRPDETRLTPEALMQRAGQLARDNVAAGGGPFGAVIARDGVILGEGVNQVTSCNDPTAHAEMQAIRAACARLGSFSLKGCEIFSSCEPCPMCLTAIYWARLDRLWYACTREEAAAIGFDDAFFYQEVAREIDARSLPTTHLAASAASAAFKAWDETPDKIAY